MVDEVDPRVEQLRRTSTHDLVVMLIGIHEANPDGDEDWKQLIKEELKRRPMEDATQEETS